ncbi:MAG: type II secretion system F family protein [Bdellovibrionota bacterium]|jgi:Flp pilus assembly protein TadB
MFFSSRRDIENLAHELLHGTPDFRDNFEKKDPALQGVLKELFYYTGLQQSEIKKYLRHIIFVVLAIILFVIIVGRFELLLAVPIYVAIEYLLLQRIAWKRTEDFERDYVPFLLSLASGVRTGMDPFVAICECGSLFPSTSSLRKEVSDLQEKVSRGVSEDTAVREFAASILHPDIQLFRSTFILARREGSSLGDSLRRLGRVTRQRQSFRRKLKGALAMQRLSAIGITGCAVLIGLLQAVTNIDALKDAFNHPLGSLAMMFGVGLIALGLVWMLYLSRRRI